MTSNLYDRASLDDIKTIFCTTSFASVLPRKVIDLPSQQEPMEDWLRRASHAGRAQGRNLNSAVMLNCSFASIV